MKRTITMLGILSILLILPLLATGCVSVGFGPYSGSIGVRNTIYGNGVRETREFRDLGSFSEVVLHGGAEVTYKNSDEPYVIIEMDENLYEYIDVSAKNDRLEIKEISPIQPRNNTVNITIGAPTLNGVQVYGAVDFLKSDTIVTKDFTLDVSGAVSAKIDIEATTVEIDGAGASDVTLSGSCDSLSIDMSGAGMANTRNLIAKNVDIKISGSGVGEVYASDSLAASVSGAGSIEYWGNPTTVKQNMSGFGSISSGE